MALSPGRVGNLVASIMKAESSLPWFLLALVIPIVVAWLDGSTYAFAVSVIVIGIIFYFINTFLIRYFIKRQAPTSLDEGWWELTAGTGIVPKWVSSLGLFGTGFIPSGINLAL